MTDQEIQLPRFIEVEQDQFKGIESCSAAELRKAAKRSRGQNRVWLDEVADALDAGCSWQPDEKGLRLVGNPRPGRPVLRLIQGEG